jgi:hypothetical protein
MDMAWRIPAAAGYVVLGLAGSVASPSMAAPCWRLSHGRLRCGAGSWHSLAAAPERCCGRASECVGSLACKVRSHRRWTSLGLPDMASTCDHRGWL